MTIYDYLPVKIRQEAKNYEKYKLEEIRVRNGFRTNYICRNKSFLGKECSNKDIEEMINYLSDYSWYAISEQLKNGFFTVNGGHRIGVAGRMGYEKNEIKSIDDIGALNIRIAHEIKGVAKKIVPFLLNNDEVANCLFVSLPGAGKTTYLRDTIRLLSGGELGRRIKVALVDERSEIAACYKGRPQNDLGESCDVMDNCPKTIGTRMLLRSMSPEVIAVDELGSKEDFAEVENIIKCGIKILGTIHCSLKELREKELAASIERFVYIEKNSFGKRQVKVFDKDFRELFYDDGDCCRTNTVENKE